MAIIHRMEPALTGTPYERICRAKGCDNLIRFTANGELCIHCYTLKRKGRQLTLKHRRKS
jgi:hypothetical protein